MESEVWLRARASLVQHGQQEMRISDTSSQAYHSEIFVDFVKLEVALSSTASAVSSTLQNQNQVTLSEIAKYHKTP